MPTTRRGQASSSVATAVRAGRVVAVLAAVALLAYGARTSAIVVLVIGVVGGALVSARLDTQAKGQRDRLFEEWAQRRGLRSDPDPVTATHRFVLLQERSLKIIQAATKPADDDGVTVLEWKFSTGSQTGRPVRCTGLLVRGGPTGPHVLLRSGGRRLPRVPGTPPQHETGFAELDDAFTITLEDDTAPDWIDAGVAEALAAFAQRRASVEFSEGEGLVKCGQLDPEEWDELLADGERLAAALARAADR